MTKIIVAIVFLMLAVQCLAQDSPFWDKQRKIEFSVLGAEIGVDGYYTQKLNKLGYIELNPLAASLVYRGPKGQVAASLIGFGAALGPAYLLHRLHHDNTSHWMMRVVLALEGVNDFNQGRLYYQRGY